MTEVQHDATRLLEVLEDLARKVRRQPDSVTWSADVQGELHNLVLGGGHVTYTVTIDLVEEWQETWSAEP